MNHSLEAGLFLDQSKWEDCLKSASRGLEMDADDESCLFYRGMALARLGRGDDADKDSLRLLGMDAGDPANHMSRGYVLLESGRTREATEHFTESLRIDPTREDAKSGLILAVIQTRPIAGRLLKMVEKLSDLSVWVILVGFIVVGRIRAGLESSENYSVFGNVLDGLIWAFIFLCLSAHMVMELSLRADPLTKNALPDRHREGLKWALPFLVMALLLKRSNQTK